MGSEGPVGRSESFGFLFRSSFGSCPLPLRLLCKGTRCLTINNFCTPIITPSLLFLPPAVPKLAQSSHPKCRPQPVSSVDRPTACNCPSAPLSRKYIAVGSRALPRPPSLGFRVLHQSRLLRRRPSLLRPRRGAHFACSSSGSLVPGRAPSVRG